MSSFNTILHPTDFSASASEALRIACSLAREHGAKLTLLHVAQRPVSSVAGMPVPPPPTIDCSGLKAELDAVASLAAGINHISIESRILEGEPASVIVNCAEQAGADIIVIGSHGRTGLSRLLVGSVAEHVVRRAGCPVLTVKTPGK